MAEESTNTPRLYLTLPCRKYPTKTSHLPYEGRPFECGMPPTWASIKGMVYIRTPSLAYHGMARLIALKATWFTIGVFMALTGCLVVVNFTTGEK